MIKRRLSFLPATLTFSIAAGACGDDAGMGDLGFESADGGETENGEGSGEGDSEDSDGEEGGSGSGSQGSGSQGSSSAESEGTSGGSSDTGTTTATTTSDTSGTSSSTETGSSTTASTSSGSTDDTGGSCGGVECPANFLCKHDTCVPDLGPCNTHDDCPGDSYCDAEGDCTPYGVPPDIINDPDCERPETPPGITPTVQCEWTGAEVGDPTEGSHRLYTTPIVVDLNLDNDPGKLQPSIIATTWQDIGGLGRTGMLRVFDGRTCEEQARLGGADEADPSLTRPGYAAQWAVGDLDGDVPTGGHPEIVGLHRVGSDLSAYAVEVDATGPTPVLGVAWIGRDCSDDSVIEFSNHQAHFGPNIHDLDDDGIPEVIIDTFVFDDAGCLLNVGETDDTQYLGDKGVQSALADVDLDERPELVRHDGIYDWDEMNTEWVLANYFTQDPAQQYGYVAIVDAGAYSTGVGAIDPAVLPEVVVVSASTRNAGASDTGSIRLQALDGSIAWGPIELYRGEEDEAGRGGPPTASDFDGDGQPEFATAGSTFYAVYDPDCDASLNGASPAQRPGGTCVRSPEMADMPDGVLWAQASQDASSNITGSSVFDFDGDGDSEAVYRDECYVRVYDGATGTVVFSAPASSGTGMEFAVIADVDGDFATEIVVPRTNSSGCPSPDPLFPDSGEFVSSSGFVILRDPMDRWANSRPIWNQHAYSITHVEDNGVIPRSSEVEHNWLADGLNNFRQNTQGENGVKQLADLTVEFRDLDDICNSTGGTFDITARVCNRGTNPVQDGVQVEFVETLPPQTGIDQGSVVCSTQTNILLQPGDCETLTCEATLGAGGELYVVVDPEDLIADCHPANNEGAGSLLLCPQ